MKKGNDLISNHILKIINSSVEPLETKEIEDVVKETRVIILYRLRELRAESLIRGKQVGSGKGTWIWWSIKQEGKKR